MCGVLIVLDYQQSITLCKILSGHPEQFFPTHCFKNDQDFTDCITVEHLDCFQLTFQVGTKIANWIFCIYLHILIHSLVKTTLKVFQNDRYLSFSLFVLWTLDGDRPPSLGNYSLLSNYFVLFCVSIFIPWLCRNKWKTGEY